MGLDRAPSHLELSCNLIIVTALQQQFGDLLFARTQRNHRLFHANSPSAKMIPDLGDSGYTFGPRYSEMSVEGSKI